MSRKFILIDQSISSLSGHHYEYAYHVLQAAQEAGFTPYLATNLKFRDQVPVSWQIVPAYRYGFWASQSSAEWEKQLDAARRSWARLWFRTKCSFRYSIFGVIWGARHQFGDFLLRQPIDRNRLLPILPFIPLVVLFKILKFVLMLGLLPVAAVLLTLRSLWRWMWSRPVVRQSASALLDDVYGSYKMMAHVWSRRAGILQWIREFRSLRRFSSDTARLFERVRLAQEDVVFIPTISTVEMMGLKLFFQRNPSLPKASWHLLYRRDIYRGRETDYARQGWVGAMGGAFQSFLSGAGNQRVFFYTDTQELTAQYNRLGAATFHTVPIPHTHRPAEQRFDGPLRLIYVGDARREKGYHLIPHVVQELWSDYVRTGRIAFTLQSNYNVPQGEPEAVIAKGFLRALPSASVELLEKPLSSEQYAELLLSGDINLLLYDRENYYARSSGILVESLAAGMPVVVPAGSWLSRQFLAEQYEWQQGLNERMTPVKAFGSDQLRWQRKSGPPQIAQDEIVASAAEAVSAMVRVPSGASLALITCEYGPGINEGLLTVESQDAMGQPLAKAEPVLLEGAERRNAVFIEVLKPGASRLVASWRSPAQSSSVMVRRFRIEFLSGEMPPLSAIGVAYHHTRDVAGCVRELIDHYPHYRRTAVEFSKRWFAYHNARRLVDVLVEKADGKRPATTRAEAFV